jgi:hypothetical protein
VIVLLTATSVRKRRNRYQACILRGDVYEIDPITCPIEQVLGLRPSFTMVGGRAVYDPDGVLGQESDLSS